MNDLTDYQLYLFCTPTKHKLSKAEYEKLNKERREFSAERIYNSKLKKKYKKLFVF
jgi:hypothetical protein